jgi:hypothetical protein
MSEKTKFCILLALLGLSIVLLLYLNHGASQVLLDH